METVNKETSTTTEGGITKFTVRIEYRTISGEIGTITVTKPKRSRFGSTKGPNTADEIAAQLTQLDKDKPTKRDRIARLLRDWERSKRN